MHSPYAASAPAPAAASAVVAATLRRFCLCCAALEPLPTGTALLADTHHPGARLGHQTHLSRAADDLCKAAGQHGATTQQRCGDAQGELLRTKSRTGCRSMYAHNSPWMFQYFFLHLKMPRAYNMHAMYLNLLHVYHAYEPEHAYHALPQRSSCLSPTHLGALGLHLTAPAQCAACIHKRICVSILVRLA